jgi:putative transposase
MVTPSHRRTVVSYLRATYGVSERRACRVTGASRASHRCCSVADSQDELRMRVRELAQARVRYGYRRIHVLLRREGWPVNHKRIYRLYRDERLAIRARTPRRRRSPQYRTARPEVTVANQTWAMDFVSDTLFDGQRIRLLTVLDCFSRESLAIVPRVHFRATQVADVLDRLVRERGAPRTIRCDIQTR